MREYFQKKVDESTSIASDGDMRLHLVSSVRLLLQQVVFGLLEWAGAQPTREGAFLPTDILEDVRQASDGTLIDALEKVAIYCEQIGWHGVSRALFTPIDETAACRSICGSSDITTISLLRGLVRLRNDGAEGHGLGGDYDRAAERDCLQRIHDAFSPLLPRVRSGEAIVFGPDDRPVELRFLRLFDGVPGLIRTIKRVDRSKLRVEVQFVDRAGKRQSSTFEAVNFLSALNTAASPRYETWKNSWSPLCYLPERTTETFQGRGPEQKLLSEWMDDFDSRTCLVYGDGGVGKTTLIIEFLHRLLDEDPGIGVGWKPQAISFYTAKKWRWGINGVELIAAGNPHLLGLIAHLHLLLLGRPADADFYRLDVGPAASRLQQLMSDELGLKRDDHLVIIDNSETLISTDRDVEKLGRELRDISRRIGRVIITSRRREVLEATPVAIDKLEPTDAITLLKRRSVALGLNAIQRATGANLDAVVKELGSRPIVMEAFLQALANPSTATLDKAKARVSAMLRRDLGEFLFADAWARYSQDLKRLLLLMTRVADVHDARQLAICCEACGITMQAAEEALEESSGIASIVRLSSGLEVTFSQNFLEFSKDKHVLIGDEQFPRQEEIDRARRLYGQFVQAVRSFPGDRIAPAFRTPLAKAAHRARKEGRIEEALRLYQQAVLSDSRNGWLFDRFAYFLFHDLRDNNAALIEARRATDLLPSEGEVWLTRGIIEARQGEYRLCESSLERAEALGIERSRCATQRAWAYLKASPALLNLAKREIEFIEQSLASVPKGDRRWIETDHLRSRLEFLDSRGRHVRG